jgi:NADPH-dependent 7-cyano-7-deazaguanine reductase QueF-like protein
MLINASKKMVKLGSLTFDLSKVELYYIETKSLKVYLNGVHFPLEFSHDQEKFKNILDRELCARDLNES